MSSDVQELEVSPDQAVVVRSGRHYVIQVAADDLVQRLKKAYRERLQELATRDPDAFRGILRQVFREKVDDTRAAALTDQAVAGEFPVPESAAFLPAEAMGAGHNAAYARLDGGTVFFLDEHEPHFDRLLDLYTEEAAHHLDVQLGPDDTVGDEGSAFLQGVKEGGPLSEAQLQEHRRYRDDGTVTVDGQQVTVEFNTELPFIERNGQKIPLFIHGKTFENMRGAGWVRDNVELEAAMTLKGVEGRELFEICEFDDREGFDDLARVGIMEALTAGGFPLDEIPWERDDHRVREGQLPSGEQVMPPYVWVTIESDRFPIHERRRYRRIDLGTDIMDDIYYDTDDFKLLQNSMSVRARKRWDTQTEMRRLLIALKMEAGVDQFGIKRAAKTDVRRDGPSPDQITELDQAVMRGHSSWGTEPIVPLRRMYNFLKDRNLLQDADAYEDVLMIKPKAFLRSVRSRFHFNEVRRSDLVRLYQLAHTRFASLLGLARAALAVTGAGELRSLLRDNTEAMVQTIEGLQDGTALKEFARGKLKELGFDVDTADMSLLLPTASWSEAKTRDLDDLMQRHPELEQRRVVAEALNDLFHHVVSLLDDDSGQTVRRAITGTLERDRDLEDHVEWFVDWLKETQPDQYGAKTTLDAFVEAYQGMVGNQGQMDAYNTYGAGEWRRFQQIDADGFERLGDFLRNEMVRIWQRQIEAGGSVCLGLWFDNARDFYIPASNRTTGNFLIDTMDFAAMYHADVWGDTPPPERTAAVDLTQDRYMERFLHATFVNEVQIELTQSGEYTDRLKSLGGTFELPRQFMRWADGQGRSDHVAFFDELSGMQDDALNEQLAAFNEFNKAQGSSLAQYLAEDFRNMMDKSRLTVDVRDNPNMEDERVNKALEGARFVFEQYRDILGFIGRLKEESIIEEMEDQRDDQNRPGPNGEWVAAEGSKGSIAIGLVRGQSPAPPQPTAAGTGTPDHDQALLDLAAASASTGGRISRAEARQLFDLLKDGGSYDAVEKATLAKIRREYTFTQAADRWLRAAIRDEFGVV